MVRNGGVADNFVYSGCVNFLKTGNGGRRVIPITQQHVADTLGLSLVHTNKTLRKLSDRKLMRWQDKGCEILDADGLLELAGWEGLKKEARPFI